MNRYLLAAAVAALIAVVAAAGVIAVKYALKPHEALVETKTYHNVEYGYSLSYPASFDMLEYLPTDAVFGHIDGDMVNAVAEARVITVDGAPGSTFEVAVIQQLENLCAADGPNGSFSCTGVKDLRAFTADAGLAGYELTLVGEHKDFGTGETESVDKGPYYVFMLRTGATSSAALVVHPPLNQSAAEADAAAIAAIAKSVQLDAAAE